VVKFEAGSYALDSEFISSIARFEGNGKEWVLGMVLVKMAKKYSSAEEAALFAKIDIDNSQDKAVASEGKSTLDHELVRLGYNRLEE
jgi:hypothetical protein